MISRTSRSALARPFVNRERDVFVIAAYRAMGCFRSAAEAYGISTSRAHQIVTRHERETGEVVLPYRRDKSAPRRASAKR